jgi:hypothetical protein
VVVRSDLDDLGAGRDDGRLLSPAELHDWRHSEFDRLAAAVRFTADERVRADALRQLTAIFLEHNPWIVGLQPREDHGLPRYVEFTPSPHQRIELRRFNFRMRRGRGVAWTSSRKRRREKSRGRLPSEGVACLGPTHPLSWWS